MYEVNAYVFQTIRGPGTCAGAWGYVLECPDTAHGTVTREQFCKEIGTANSLELMAAIAALEALKPTYVTLFLDVEHVATCINKGWLAEWKGCGWLGKNGRPVKNRELWERLAGQLERMPVSVTYSVNHPYIEWMSLEIQRRFG